MKIKNALQILAARAAKSPLLQELYREEKKKFEKELRRKKNAM
jgi:hypothetical protein